MSVSVLVFRVRVRAFFRGLVAILEGRQQAGILFVEVFAMMLDPTPKIFLTPLREGHVSEREREDESDEAHLEY